MPDRDLIDDALAGLGLEPDSLACESGVQPPSSSETPRALDRHTLQQLSREAAANTEALQLTVWKVFFAWLAMQLMVAAVGYAYSNYKMSEVQRAIEARSMGS